MIRGVYAKKANSIVMKEMQTWFRECLGCVAGRREFARGRYMMTVIDDTDTAAKILAVQRQFRRSVLAYDKVACIMVFNHPRFYDDSGINVTDAITYLAQQIAPVAHVPVDQLMAGGSAHQRHAIKCPVTGAPTIYDDFDAIAFCPQANDKGDRLYDPLMAAPYPCVNISSDIFAFSMLARDRFVERTGREIFNVHPDDAPDEHLVECGALWQRIAVRTIRNYVAMTDTSLCPTYLSADQRYWFANHKDPAFAESEKRLYRHEMPSTYAPQIIQGWKRMLYERATNRLRTATKPGELL
jgi:hypothetical protein